jgi:hypothetical protein
MLTILLKLCECLRAGGVRALSQFELFRSQPVRGKIRDGVLSAYVRSHRSYRCAEPMSLFYTYIPCLAPRHGPKVMLGVPWCAVTLANCTPT